MFHRHIIRPLILIVLLTCTSTHAANFVSKQPLQQPDIQVYFSPGSGCTEAVVDALKHAQKTVLVQAYSFTSAPIAKALVDAHKRGVSVTVILDKSQRTQQYSEADFTAHAGITTYIDAKHAIAHNKIIKRVDRAALDVALELGIACGGWCPEADNQRIAASVVTCRTIRPTSRLFINIINGCGESEPCKSYDWQVAGTRWGN